MQDLNEPPARWKSIGPEGSITGSCPLRHTEVRGAISGCLARVNVTQIFENTVTQRIEAVYTFLLPDNAAIDDMTIQIGSRTMRGVIRKKEEARAIYERAKQSGHVAASSTRSAPTSSRSLKRTFFLANRSPSRSATRRHSNMRRQEHQGDESENDVASTLHERFHCPRRSPAGGSTNL
jgi:hypothetical protein